VEGRLAEQQQRVDELLAKRAAMQADAQQCVFNLAGQTIILTELDTDNTVKGANTWFSPEMLTAAPVPTNPGVDGKATVTLTGEPGRWTNADDNLHEFCRTQLSGPVTSLDLKVDWNDQGWGNQKGTLVVRLEHAGVRVFEFTPFPIAPHRPQVNSASLNASQCREQKLDQAVAGDYLVVLRRTGGGGGHELEIRSFTGSITCGLSAPSSSNDNTLNLNFSVTPRFSDLNQNMVVKVKVADDLTAIFNNPSSQWSRELARRVQNNTIPRMAFAGRSCVVSSVDTSDNTVQLHIPNTTTKSWFTPEMLLIAAPVYIKE